MLVQKHIVHTKLDIYVLVWTNDTFSAVAYNYYILPNSTHWHILICNTYILPNLPFIFLQIVIIIAATKTAAAKINDRIKMCLTVVSEKYISKTLPFHVIHYIPLIHQVTLIFKRLEIKSLWEEVNSKRQHRIAEIC
jgi:hypothetical protein